MSKSNEKGPVGSCNLRGKHDLNVSAKKEKTEQAEAEEDVGDGCVVGMGRAFGG